jgi:hypothetical protein
MATARAHNDAERVVANLRDGFAVSLMPDGAGAFLAAVTESQREMLSFLAMRLEKDSQIAREASECENWADLLELHSRWSQDMLRDYGAELSRMVAMSSTGASGPSRAKRQR